MKILIVGKGQMGQLFSSILKKQPEIVVDIVSRKDDVINSLKTTKYAAIVIATPYQFHYEYIKQAIVSQLDVFVEKPATYNYDQAVELYNLGKSNSTMIAVGQVLRYLPVSTTLKKHLKKDQQSIQVITIKRITSKLHPKKWWTEQQRFLTLFEGIHSVDFIHFLTGEDYELRETSMKNTDDRFQGETYFTATLKSSTHRVHIHHEIRNTKSMNEITIYTMGEVIQLIDYSRLEVNGEEIYHNELNRELNKGYENQMDTFLSDLKTKKSESCNISNVIQSMKIIESIYTKNTL